MKKTITVFLVLIAVSAAYSQAGKEDAAETSQISLEDQRLDIIHYGTDTEITNLIKTLLSEQNADRPVQSAQTEEKSSPPVSAIDKALVELAGKTKNKTILAGIFGFFADSKREGLQERAIRAVEERDEEAVETVSAAIDYLGRLESGDAGEVLEDILNGEESRFMNASIRALGKIAKNRNAEDTAEFLIDYYTNRDPGDENRREIIIAVGAAGSSKGVPFLASIAENNDERVPLRMAALAGLSGIGDTEGLPAVLSAVSSDDPNIRSSAIAALGPFQGDAVDAAILEAFRDSYYRTRIAAAQAARERKLALAIPYLKFRSENDDIPAVKDEAIKALGAIDTEETKKALEALFAERKNGDRVRIAAAEMLLQNNPSAYTEKVVAELDYAKSKNQTVLYNGFLRILGGTKTGSIEDLARRFFASGGVTEKSYALDMCLNNDLRSLADEVRKLADPKNGSLARKAQSVLDTWGL